MAAQSVTLGLGSGGRSSPGPGGRKALVPLRPRATRGRASSRQCAQAGPRGWRLGAGPGGGL